MTPIDPSSAAPRAVSRRALVVGAAAAVAAPFVLRSRPARAAGRVNVLAYDGFIPPAFKQHFEAETGIEIRIKPVASQAPELALLIAERDAPQSDIATVAGHRLNQFVASGVLAPLDTARLSSWGALDPAYTRADWLSVGGAVMGVPLAFGAEMMVAHRSRPAPDSWGAFFDTRYAKRTTYTVEDFLQCVMLYQGADGTFVSYLGDRPAAMAAVTAARDLLIRSKPQVLKYYETGAEVQQLLLSEEVLLAQAYAGTLSSLILKGAPLRLVVPKEGSFAFAYTLALVKDGPNRDNAYKLLDALLSFPGAAATITRAAGYMTTFRDPAAGLSEIEQQAYAIPAEARARLRFFRYEGQALSSSLIDKAVAEVKAA